MCDIQMSETYEYNVSEDKKILIYENDIKYNKFVDKSKVVGNVKSCTIESRIQESIIKDPILLCLSYLDLEHVPNLVHDVTKLIYLFISNNKITSAPNLSYLKNVTTLDLSNNMLISVSLLPPNIEELSLMNNNITCIQNLQNYGIKKLDVSYNKIKTVPIMNKLEILSCDHNDIEVIKSFPKLIKLFCGYNNIKKIEVMSTLQILECEHNKIGEICGFTHLVELYCVHNNIGNINKLPNIEVLHCYNNNVTIIEYFEHLYELSCDCNDRVCISQYYKFGERHSRDGKIVIQML